MEKKEISNKSKKTAIIVMIILAVVAASALIIFGIIGLQVNKSVETASYSTKSEIGYNLNLIEDPLYNKDTIEFGDGYVTKFINDIDLNFQYGFDSSNAANISGTQSATAILEAKYNDKDLIWRKEYQLVPQTVFYAKNAAASAKLPIKEYVDFADNLRENSGVTTSVNLTVTYTVDASATIDGQQIAETSESTLVIPITGDVFVIGGTPLSEQSKAIETEVLQELLPKKPILICSSIILFLLIGAIIWLSVFTIGVRENPIELELNKITKKYSSRLVALHENCHLSDCETVSVNSFKDLILVADEVRKPIFRNSSAGSIGTEFFVYDDPKKYIYKAEYLKELIKKADEVPPNSSTVLASSVSD